MFAVLFLLALIIVISGIAFVLAVDLVLVVGEDGAARDGRARIRGRRRGLGVASAGALSTRRRRWPSSALDMLSKRAARRNRGAGAARRPTARLQRQSAALALRGRPHTHFFVARRVRSIVRGRSFSRVVKIQQAGAGLRAHVYVASS